MCRCSIDRRMMLKLSGASAASLLGGCDKIDLVSDATVEAMGLQAWADIRQTTDVAADRTLQAALDDVSRRLLLAAHETPESWEVLVFRGPEVNAFALPGRKIGVYEGMFNVVANEDQLAVIVGHEIGHVHAEHSQERMNAEVAKGWGLRVLSLLLQFGEVEYAAEIAAALGVGVEYGWFFPTRAVRSWRPTVWGYTRWPRRVSALRRLWLYGNGWMQRLPIEHRNFSQRILLHRPALRRLRQYFQSSGDISLNTSISLTCHEMTPD